MKVEKHIADRESYEASIRLLLKNDPVRHRKLIVEGCVLASANALNLALHRLNRVAQNEDIKHNKLEGFILRSKPFDDKSEEISRICRTLEDLKYRVVHGSSLSETDVRKAMAQYEFLLRDLEGFSPGVKGVEKT